MEIALDIENLPTGWRIVELRLKDDSIEDSDNLPDPGGLAREIVGDLEAALQQFRLIAEDLGEPVE